MQKDEEAALYTRPVETEAMLRNGDAHASKIHLQDTENKDYPNG